jgi:hypothetical protein
MAADPSGLNAVVKESLDRHLGDIEAALERDGIAIDGPIFGGLDLSVRDALEAIDNRNSKDLFGSTRLGIV